jgi:hypothetical protein
MVEYSKIQTLFKRDTKGRIIEGDWSIPEIEYLKDNNWIWTEKVDGTNIRISFTPLLISPWDIEIQGRTKDAQTPNFLLDKLKEMFPSKRLHAAFPDMKMDVTLYGEGYGPKIQKGGGKYRSDVSFVLFDVKIGSWWLKRPDIEDVASKLGIDVVPICGTGTLHQAINYIKSGTMKSQWGNFLAEGIVARPEVELFTRKGERMLTKIKHKDFGITELRCV